MFPVIVHSRTVLTLLGGSLTQFSHVKQALSGAPILVAADGGANLAVASGVIPDAVIGDMDSISPEARVLVPKARLHQIAEQDSTDFEKCLRHIKAPAILAYGFTGGRLDHELAACTALVRHPEQRCILIGEEDICFLAPSTLTLDLPLGTRFSLYPMGDVTGTSTGLLYPIDGLEFSPATRVGTSNEVTGPVTLSFETRKMLVILPRETLPALLKTLV